MKTGTNAWSAGRWWVGPVIILLAAIVAVGPLFSRGPSCMSDFDFHFISWIDAERSMSSGLLYPHWANSPNFGAGEPKFVFYPPITWMAGAVLGMLLPWPIVPLVLFVLLLFAIGIANRALAKMAFGEGPATLAGCAAIFLGFALFSIYMRNDFGELMGGFWIPLLLLFALRRRGQSSNFWNRAFDGSATPLALIMAGTWLSNGPVAIMASYLLAAVSLVSALSERSFAPVVRAIASTIVGMGLAALYLIPAVSERNWINLQSALHAGYGVENNWLFASDPSSPSSGLLTLGASQVAVFMLGITFAGGAIALIRGMVPKDCKGLIPIALIPPTVLFLLLPVSRPVWNLLPELRLLQFPWRWLVVLEAPMAICFASAVWFERRNKRIAPMTACAALFVAVSLLAPSWWFSECGSRLSSFQNAARQGIGVVGESEYTPPGIRTPLIDFLLDKDGNVLFDSQGNPILNLVPSACLLDSPPEASTQGDAALAPSWSGNASDCKSSGWIELGLARDPSNPEASKPEQKWFAGAASHAGFLILRLRYYPAWSVRVNGVPVTATSDRQRGLMAVPVPQGNVLVQVDWTTTGDVVLGRWVSCAALLLIIGLYSFERRFRRSFRTMQPKQGHAQKNVQLAAR